MNEIFNLLEFWVFTNENELEKTFHWEKWNFQGIGNYVHTRDYLALVKALLPRM